MGNILNKKDLEEIKLRIADLKRDDLPIWGKMNVGEMLCHTADQVKLATGEKLMGREEDQVAHRDSVLRDGHHRTFR